MSTLPPSEITVPLLESLRRDADPLRTITALLRVHDMGPADHIRTKHEVRDYLRTGDPRAADEIIRRAAERRATRQAQILRVVQDQRPRQSVAP